MLKKSNMASYFDEHDCVPLAENERPNDEILLARLLLDSGIATALNLDFGTLSASQNLTNLPPPTSKDFLQNELPKHFFNESEKVGYECPICIVKFEKKESNDNSELNAVKLPGCGHTFHNNCLLRWLNHTSMLLKILIFLN